MMFTHPDELKKQCDSRYRELTERSGEWKPYEGSDVAENYYPQEEDEEEEEAAPEKVEASPRRSRSGTSSQKGSVKNRSNSRNGALSSIPEEPHDGVDVPVPDNGTVIDSQSDLSTEQFYETPTGSQRDSQEFEDAREEAIPEQLPDSSCTMAQIERSRSSRNRHFDKPQDSTVVGKYGSRSKADFLEVCSGSERLSDAVRRASLSVLDPVDILTGWDLLKPVVVQRLKDRIAAERPFLTHFAPDCRIFSAAYHWTENDNQYMIA